MASRYVTGSFTPITLMALEKGLRINDSVAPNQEMVDQLLSYSTYSTVEMCDEMLNNDDELNSSRETVFNILQPIRSLVGTDDYSAKVYTPLHRELEIWLSLLMGKDTGKHSKFTSLLNTATNKKDKFNEEITSGIKSKSMFKSTFTSMDEMMTASVSGISTDINLFGEELKSMLPIMRFEYIPIFGTPEYLFRILYEMNGISIIQDNFDAVGMTHVIVSTLGNDPSPIDKKIQRSIYTVFESITDQTLLDILMTFGIEDENITALSDLLNLEIIFPKSAITLRSMNYGEYKNIYVKTGISDFTASLDCPYIGVMPADIAKANQAFSIGMQQIKNLSATKPDKFADMLINLKSTKGLDAISGSTEAIPDEVADSLAGSHINGTDEDGKYFTTDFMGSVSGDVHTDALTLINTGLMSTETQTLESILSTAKTDIDYAISALPAEVSRLVNKYGNKLTKMNEALDDMSTKISKEKAAFAEAEIDIYMKVDESYVINFAEGISSVAQETQPGGAVEILEKTALPTEGGEYLLAALREDENKDILRKAGIILETKIPNK